MSSEKIFFTNLDELRSGLDADESHEIHVDSFSNSSPENSQWFTEEYEGQLSVDVYQTDDEIIIKSTIAGVEPDDLDIFLHDDMLTIRGKRSETEEQQTSEYFYKECYWGGFSRSIILPNEVNPDTIQAELENGILTIRLSKIERTKTVEIKVNKKK